MQQHTITGLLLALGLVGCTSAESLRARTAPPPPAPMATRAPGGQPGSQAPTLDELTLVFGELPPHWRGLRGHITVLEFWSPWCPICELVHQRMNEWNSQWQDYDVVVLGVAPLPVDETRTHARRLELGYAVASDASERLFDAYAISALPTLLLVDASGRIVRRVVGYFPDQLAALSRELLALVAETADEAANSSASMR